MVKALLPMKYYDIRRDCGIDEVKAKIVLCFIDDTNLNRACGDKFLSGRIHLRF